MMTDSEGDEAEEEEEEENEAEREGGRGREVIESERDGEGGTAVVGEDERWWLEGDGRGEFDLELD